MRIPPLHGAADKEIREDEMRMDRLFNAYATVLRFRGADGLWGSLDHYTETGPFPCRIRAVSGREYVDGRVRGEATHRIYLPAGIVVGPMDRIEVLGTVYDVLPPVRDAGGGVGHHLEVDLKECL